MPHDEKLDELRHEYTVALREGDTEKATELYRKAKRLKDEALPEDRDDVVVTDETESDDDDLEQFEALNGIGDEIAEEMYEEFGSLDAVRDASVEALTDISGIGTKRAENLQDELAE